MSFISWTKIKSKAFSAVENGECDLLLNIIEEYPKVLTAYNISNESLLHVAANEDNIELLKLLVEKGLDVNVGTKNDKSNTPLCNAAYHGSIRAARWLIEHGANVDVGYDISGTPLCVAAMNGKREVVKLLLESGADVNASYCIGEGESLTRMNALKLAEIEGYDEVAKVLRSYGAIETNENEKTNKLDISNRHNEILQYIKSCLGPIKYTLSEIIPVSRVSINLHIIPPTNEKNWITVVTSGMSDCAMEDDDSEIEEDLKYAELLIKLPSDWKISKKDFEDNNNYWPFEWIRQIAHMPHMYDGWIDEGIIIPNGEPPEQFASNTKVSCIIICKSKEKGLEKYKCSDGRIINFYTLIPIYGEEAVIAMEKGSEYLLELLSKKGIGDIIDINRVNLGWRK
ncbi:suppressor of fused domain protein [Clostridium sp. DJ247]|uniref:suppressor of fused domain protein n=1 Tax=Clostridium sp. DJ247 TaxID=2726188 RepID=UPI001623E891|nr:suppressor of fused domain protein [Clostridium sp. DJ247]MBC2582809.1 hypothetical protein [Clostridium sp. DJ247]